MKKISRLDVFIAGVVSIIVLFSYKGLFQTFFQQDEWLTQGAVFSGGIFAELKQYSLVDIIAGAGRPFGSLINYILFFLFPFRIDIFVWFAIIVHIINCLILYVLLVQITKKRLIASIGTFVFALNFTASQSVSWIASIFTTLPAGTCVFLSLMLFYQYLKFGKFRFLLGAQILAIISYLFKESSIFLFFLFPVVHMMCNTRKISLSRLCTLYSLSLLYACFVVVVRMRYVMGLGQSAGAFVSNSSSMWQKMLTHIFLYPILSLPQIYMPQQIMIAVSGWFQKINYGGLQGFSSSQRGVETIVSDFTSFILAMVILFSVYLVGEHTKQYKKLLYFIVFFIFLSFIPFAILDKGSAYLDSRYFYIGSAGGSFLLALIVDRVLSGFQKANAVIYRFMIAVSVFLLCGFLFKNYQWISRDIRSMVVVSNERKYILSEIRRFAPDTTEKPVYFITGNNNGYYGIPEVKIPFQQGIGYTLMVWNYSFGHIPAALLRETFLWRIREEGYREINGKGFGYFHSLSTLQTYVRNGHIDISQVIAFYYNTDTKLITDITEETRKSIVQQ